MDDDDALLLTTGGPEEEERFGSAEGSPGERRGESGSASGGNESAADHDDGASEDSGGSDDAGDDADGRDQGAAVAAGEEQLGATVGDDEELTGEALKKAMKKRLSKKEYKKWKKQHGGKKKDKKRDKKKDRKKDKKKEKKGDQDTKKSKAPAAPKKRQRDEDAPAEDNAIHRRQEEVISQFQNALQEEGGISLRAPIDAGPRRRAAGGTNRAAQKAKEDVHYRQLAEETVEKMREAYRRDVDALSSSNKGVPLNRLSIRDEVMAVALKVPAQEHLVAAGFLDQLAQWLQNGRDLAPMDLRVAALKVLAIFPFEGVDRMDNDDEEDEKKIRKNEMLWFGVNSDDLARSSIGAAVNFVRTHPSETAVNRRAATFMLSKLAKVYHFGGDADMTAVRRQRQKPLTHAVQDDEIIDGLSQNDSASQQGVDGTQRDNLLYSPYDIVVSEGEAFQVAVQKPDPTDPMSYVRCPIRYPRDSILRW